MNNEFIFTTENLLENIEKVGAWSSYALAAWALQELYPNEYDEDGHCELDREIELVHEYGCEFWQDVIVKFQTEVGYKPNGGTFSTDYVNQF